MIDIIGAEGGSRTRTTLRSTDFKSASGVLTSFYYALPSRIYRRFSRQSKLRLAWYEYVSPSSFPHLVLIHNPYLRLIRKSKCTNPALKSTPGQALLVCFGI